MSRKRKRTDSKTETETIPSNPPEKPVLFKDHRMILVENQTFQKTFKQWVSGLKITTKFTNPVTNYSFPLVADLVKRVIRTLICFVYDLLHLGYCLEKRTIRSSNLVWCYGELKIKKVKVTEFDWVKGKENLADLSRWISKIFFKAKDIPLDMERLLELLIRSPTAELLITHHFSLMNDAGRRGFICKWQDIIDQYNKEERKKHLKACGLLPYRNNWMTLVEKGGPLDRLIKNVHGTDAEYKNVPQDQPRCFRNSLNHYLRHCRINDKHGPPKFKHEDCVNLLFGTFPRAISVFPELLHRLKLLPEIRPQDFFYH